MQATTSPPLQIARGRLMVAAARRWRRGALTLWNEEDDRPIDRAVDRAVDRPPRLAGEAAPREALLGLPGGPGRRPADSRSRSRGCAPAHAARDDSDHRRDEDRREDRLVVRRRQRHRHWPPDWEEVWSLCRRAVRGLELRRTLAVLIGITEAEVLERAQLALEVIDSFDSGSSCGKQ